MKHFPFLAIVLMIISCQPKETPLSEEYIKAINEWKENRDVRLRAPTGYVNLVGLYWLEEGVNTFGSDSSNSLVFPPNAPAFMGTFNLKDSVVTFKSSDSLQVVVDSNIAKNLVIDKPNSGPTMEYQNFKWFVIERAGNIGIRLRDVELPSTKKPLNIPYFEVNKEWIITAKFKPFEAPKKYKIDNILGHSFQEDIKGELIFEKDGATYSLLPLMDENGIFLMFADETSGLETYGAGRYLVADVPDQNNEVILDFNKAYNPPCAFTDFATCPLPPQENILDLSITAGEQYKMH